jgi:hypothetical protein
MSLWYISELCSAPGRGCVCRCVSDIAFEEYAISEMWNQTAKAESKIFHACDRLRLENGRAYCPDHPVLNNGSDKREYHAGCIREYLCEPARQFQKLDETTKKKLRDQIGELNLDPFEYAKEMLKGNLFEQLLRRQ